MAVSTDMDKNRASPAIVRAAMRESRSVRAGAFRYEGDDLTTGWHDHDMHQIEYALSGVAEVETNGGLYVVPCHQAIWIPAGLGHCTTLQRHVVSISIFFDRKLIRGSGDRARVLAVSPLLREMTHYATKWSIMRTEPDRSANSFFATLADLFAEALEDEVPLRLPTVNDPLGRAIMDATRTNLEGDSDQIARAVGISPRSLRRHFATKVGLSWQQYRAQCRVVAAAGMLRAEPHRTVADVAHSVGFSNVNALTRAFSNAIGFTPSEFRAGPVRK